MNYHNEYERPLTSDDVKAIKAANDSVCGVFRADGIIDHFNEDYGTMALRLTIVKKVYGREVEIEHNIPISGKIDNYSRDGFKPDYGFAYINSPHYSQEWRTFSQFVRKGDILSALWRCDNNNQYMERVNLHHDEFLIVINRGDNSYYFHLDDGTCKQNSGRMLRMGDFNNNAPNYDYS